MTAVIEKDHQKLLNQTNPSSVLNAFFIQPPLIFYQAAKKEPYYEHSKNRKLEISNQEKHSPRIINKFDSTINNRNFIYSPFSWAKKNSQNCSRKYSKDSGNTSTSIEEEETKPKVPFKSCAQDFKIKYKTELCKYFELTGTCKFGDKCAYAHGKENIRNKVTNSTAYRTKKCREFFEHGYCPYGNRCQFSHLLKINATTNNSNNEKDNTYQMILDSLSEEENENDIKKALGSKPRLAVFAEIEKDYIFDHDYNEDNWLDKFNLQFREDNNDNSSSFSEETENNIESNLDYRESIW